MRHTRGIAGPLDQVYACGAGLYLQNVSPQWPRITFALVRFNVVSCRTSE